MSSYLNKTPYFHPIFFTGYLNDFGILSLIHKKLGVLNILELLSFFKKIYPHYLHRQWGLDSNHFIYYI